MAVLNLGMKKSQNIFKKLGHMNWSFLGLLTVISCIGFLTLYSASGGHLAPWADKQMVRFGFGMLLLFFIALIDVRYWMRYAYLLYGASFLSLLIVETAGRIAGGAQRWINLYLFHVQPSELMKITLVLALARYFHLQSDKEKRQVRNFIIPGIMILAPAGLILIQPDLGTALIVVMIGGIMLFLAGIPMWIVVTSAVGGVAAIPVLWAFLRDYQKQRVFTFLNPENDPLGSGYQIIQSKIALGSGGFFGKGFLKGSQAYLNYLPEKETDLIFTMFSEEFGMLGGVVLISLYAFLIAKGYEMAIRCRTQFGRLVCLGVISTFFLSVFINMAMVMGLLPVVGVALPLMSYGGTSLLTLLMGFGFLMSVEVHPNSNLYRPSRYEL